MEEHSPNIPVEPAGSAPSKERKRRRRRKPSRAVGSVAAESVMMWERKKEEAESNARPLLEGMKARRRLPHPEKTAEKPKESEKEASTAVEKKSPAEDEIVATSEAAKEKTKETDGEATEIAEASTDSAVAADVEGEAVAAAESEEVGAAAEEGTAEEASDKTLGELTDDEAEHVTDEYLKVRGMEVAAEQAQTQPDSDEAEALAADARLLAKINEKRQAEPDKPLETAADEALAEVMQELDIPEPETPEPGAEMEPASAETPPPQPPSPEEPTSEAQPPAGPPGGGNVPPVPPTPAPGSQGPVGPSGPRGPRPPEFFAAQPQPAAGGHGEHAPAAPKTGPAEDMIPYQESLYMERRAQTRGFLVGGILGYLIGRRRGRIRTEKRLKPIQEKLVKQVNELHDVIAVKERQIRVAAAEKAHASREQPRAAGVVEAVAAAVPVAAAAEAAQAVVPPHSEQYPAMSPAEMVAGPEPQKLLSEQQPAAHQPRAPFEQVPSVPIASLEQPIVPPVTEVARQSVPTPPAFELLAAAAAAKLTNERQPAAHQRPELPLAEMPASQIDSLTTPELLEVAAQVKIGKENLREAFENHRITEPGLRHILNEYVHGGNVKKVMKQELLNKELTYERDPRMRKHLAATLSGAGAAAGAVATVAAKAKPKVAKHSKRLASASKKVGSKALEKSRELEKQDEDMRQFIVRLWLGVTIFLGLIVIILLFR